MLGLLVLASYWIYWPVLVVAAKFRKEKKILTRLPIFWTTFSASSVIFIYAVQIYRNQIFLFDMNNILPAIMGLALAVIVWVGQDLFALLLVRDDPAVGVELVAPLAGLIGLTSAILIFDGLQGVGSMALRAQEVVWLPAAIQIGSYFLIMLPAAYAFGIAFDRGAWGVLEGVLVASVVAGLGQTALLEWKTARHRLGRAPLKET
ncbi:MAG: hypothetical protein AAFQ67_02895 [Pseudomonadota bacterium]